MCVPVTTRPTLAMSEATKALIIEIMQTVKSMTGKSFRDIRGKDKSLDTEQARQLLVLLLENYRMNGRVVRYYLNCRSRLDIEKMLALAHHNSRCLRELEVALANIQGRQWESVALRAAAINFEQMAPTWMGQILNASEIRDVVCYTLGLLTRNRVNYDRIAALNGLHLLTCTPLARARFMQVLALSGLSVYSGLVSIQAGQAGYKMVFVGGKC